MARSISVNFEEFQFVTIWGEVDKVSVACRVWNSTLIGDSSRIRNGTFQNILELSITWY